MEKILENYRKSYDALLPEINSNIEKYRKGDFKVKVKNADGTPFQGIVKAQQTKHTFDFGTCVVMLGAMGDKEQAYRDAITNLFNFVTTTFCWNITETEQGKFRFDEGVEEIYRRPPAERVWQFAKENGLKAKGQPLFCDRWVPQWASKDADELRAQWIEFIKRVAERYDGKYSLFDVVNESFDAKRSPDMPWLKEGEFNYVKWVLKTAGEIFSDKVTLERNEATNVHFGRFADRYYTELKEILDSGIRLDSMGMQYHYFNGKHFADVHLAGGACSLENMYATYQRYNSLGIPMYISEITIPTLYEGLTLAEGEELQAEVLEKLYRLWFSIPNMQGIVYWNLKDGDAWENEGDCLGCLMDSYMRKKKSYYTLEHLIKREWNTCLSERTNAEGELAFRGFYGDYELEILTEKGAVKTKASFDKTSGELVVTL